MGGGYNIIWRDTYGQDKRQVQFFQQFIFSHKKLVQKGHVRGDCRFCFGNYFRYNSDG